MTDYQYRTFTVILHKPVENVYSKLTEVIDQRYKHVRTIARISADSQKIKILSDNHSKIIQPSSKPYPIRRRSSVQPHLVSVQSASSQRSTLALSALNQTQKIPGKLENQSVNLLKKIKCGDLVPSLKAHEKTHLIIILAIKIQS